LTLQVIIIRADGAFAETEDVRRQSFVKAFSDAGFEWTIDRQRFAASRKLGSLHERMAFFLRQHLKRGRDMRDVDQLVMAMHRCACKAFTQLIEQGATAPRAGMRELVVTARQEGVRLVLAGAVRREDADRLLVHALGARGLQAFDAFTLVSEAEEEADLGALYRQVLADAHVEPACCLVIEATIHGMNAAKATGLPVIATRSSYCFESPCAGDSAGVFEDLPSVLAGGAKRELQPLSGQDRTDLLAALQQLHTGKIDGEVVSNRGLVMRVSDILKIKGSAVKTIEASATIRALAQALRVEAVGGMVVTDAKGALAGIITERDLARGLAEFGSDLSSLPVTALMTNAVITCAPEDSVATVAKVMTQRRIRHLPVVVDGQLVGLVSIGDVLKYRLDEVQLEANVLRDFALARK
jgi:CBS domain-containing protein/beta-phosphoglucomutase-like phosphatase (HAD superfamily)